MDNLSLCNLFQVEIVLPKSLILKIRDLLGQPKCSAPYPLSPPPPP